MNETENKLETWRVYKSGDGETEILTTGAAGLEYTVATMEPAYADRADAIVRDHNNANELFESASAYLLARHTGNGIAEAELRLTQAVSAYEKGVK
jgi:hypothetical protein